MISLTINGREVHAPDSLARTSLLRYLRDELAYIGPKQGCAEGGCGACMVGIAESGSEPVRAVNSCIRLLGTLQGRSITTIEGLAERDAIRGDSAIQAPANPSRVQRAMLDHAATQCGFCTPGMVISLHCLFASISDPTEDQIQYALAGNLCRCTGYRPILEAARALKKSAAVPHRMPEHSPSLPASWRSIPDFFLPRTLIELDDHLYHYPRAALLAGGTDLLPERLVTEGRETPIIYLGNIAELRWVGDKEGELEIGACVPLNEAFPAIRSRYDGLAEAFRRFASLPIANVATLGGNIATGSSVSDCVSVLLALGATIVLRHEGTVRTLPLEAFWVGGSNVLRVGEYIVAIRVPHPAPDQHVRAYKVTKRFEQDIAAVIGAFNVRLEGDTVVSARVSYGGMSATPGRAHRIEAALVGHRFDTDAVDRARDLVDAEFQPVTDVRGSARYRSLIAKNLLTKFHLEVMECEFVSLWTRA